MIVQHQSEARKRPSITAFTTIWADQNIARMLVSGVAAAAATSGFIGAGDLLLADGTARPGAAKRNGAGSAPQIGRNLGFCQTPEKPELLLPMEVLNGAEPRGPHASRAAWLGVSKDGPVPELRWRLLRGRFAAR